MNLPDLTNWSDGRLKCQIFERLAFGVLPFEQWMIVFANAEFIDRPGLRCKAFTVWFPTMIDYVRGTQERATLAKESERRGIDFGKVFCLTDALGGCYSDCLALYSRDEQLYLRDRRLQNVHGRLHIYLWDEQKAHFFDASTGSIEKCEILAADYRAIMSDFYSDMQANTLNLLDRLLGSESFDQLLSLYRTELDVETKLLPLAEELGITGGDLEVSVEGAA